MRKIKLYIAASIDGYIAQSNGDLDWLTEYPNPEKTDYGYQRFYDSIDTVIMGGHTFHNLLGMDVQWPYRGKESYIVSRSAQIVSDNNTHFITDDVIECISQIKKRDGKDIWLVGGGELISKLLNHDLIDEMIITIIPVILGGGIPLFPSITKGSYWNTHLSQRYNNGVIQTSYNLNSE